LQDLEDSISQCSPPDKPLKEFDTSCFSGKYVTGEAIGDEYFDKLFNLRNDDAKQKRAMENGDGSKRAKGSNDGCESVSNDKRNSKLQNSGSCESLSNGSSGDSVIVQS
jgi:amidophosphoribosyltransferase